MSNSLRARHAPRRCPVAVTAAVTLLAIASLTAGCGGSSSTATPSRAANATVPVAVAPATSSTASADQATAAPTTTPSPVPPTLAATIDGVILPPNRAALATRHPIAVMIDDLAAARPQSGLSQADIVYQAPAEGGIPRYMAIFQTQDPPSIGPIRSTRLYFAGWAAEWHALLAHAGGAPNAIAYIDRLQGKQIWGADGLTSAAAAGSMFRISTRRAPHNLYTTGAKMRGLLALVGATAPFTAGSWTFGDAAPPAARPTGGTLVVPYLANEIAYQYDAATNTYPRSVSREGPQIDAGNHRRVAPSNVIVLYMPVGRLWNTGPDSSNESSGRLDVRFVGSGTATVFANGVATAARWSKPNDTAPTVFTYAAGPNTGKPVPLVRGQIFVQVVASGTNVTWTPGQAPAAVP